MTHQSFSLRPAEPRDAEDIAGLFTQLGHPTDALDVPARLVEVVAAGGSVILAVDDRGKALGLASLARVRVIHAAGAVAYITGFIITAESRGQGIGLHDAAAASADVENAHEILAI